VQPQSLCTAWVRPARRHVPRVTPAHSCAWCRPVWRSATPTTALPSRPVAPVRRAPPVSRAARRYPETDQHTASSFPRVKVGLRAAGAEPVRVPRETQRVSRSPGRDPARQDPEGVSPHPEPARPRRRRPARPGPTAGRAGPGPRNQRETPPSGDGGVSGKAVKRCLACEVSAVVLVGPTDERDHEDCATDPGEPRADRQADQEDRSRACEHQRPP